MLNRSLLGMMELLKVGQLDGKILIKPSIGISKIANYPFRAAWKRFRFRSRSSGSISATFGDCNRVAGKRDFFSQRLPLLGFGAVSSPPLIPQLLSN